MAVDIERISVSLGAKRSLPSSPYENYDAHIMIEARIQPGKSLKEKNDDWRMLRKKAQAQLREALADAKNVAESAHPLPNKRALDWEGAKKAAPSKPYEGVLGFSVSGEGKGKENYYEGDTIYDEALEKENLKLGKMLREKAEKRVAEKQTTLLKHLEEKKKKEEKK